MSGIVTFGKFKGKPLEVVLRDSNYIGWCKEKGLYEKLISCVNTTNVSITNVFTSSVSIDSPTPVHNIMQNKFLDKTFVDDFLQLFIDFLCLEPIYQSEPYKKNFNDIIHPSSMYKQIFETEEGWDVGLHALQDNITLFDQSGIIDLLIAQEKLYPNKKKLFKSNRSWDGFLYEYMIENIFIELKPKVGDEYPCILRKMKSQMRYTIEAKIVHPIRVKRKYGNLIFCLLIGEFEGESITREELKIVFEQSEIRVIFIDEINMDEFESIKQKIQYHEQEKQKLLFQLEHMEKGMVKK